MLFNLKLLILISCDIEMIQKGLLIFIMDYELERTR